ncbi:hypothetical protein [Blastopirellula marina]|uniref:Uncharacterized protein n=1 Tax=Blastopirellula marina TaxID=124 RepID=A0A2S8FWV4_9BACT|nr:hypothetical protein [Blastopirellula marina]PQO36658.1 hypothetical protein C5Y98_11740 [Blastopirellula marina]PTL44488.1 hypothetical protein C5Y97_11750 [Blastopirellula marina]
MEPSIEIRHGRFTDLTGPSRASQQIVFAPAEAELLGTTFNFAQKLQVYATKRPLPTAVVGLFGPGEDAVWVRGRIQRIFAYPNLPEEERPEKCMFCGTFVALLKNDSAGYIGIPFQATDYYGTTGLIFSNEDPPPELVQSTIGNAFWELLLADPADLEDYRDRMYHSGADVFVEFGVENGAPFCETSE